MVARIAFFLLLIAVFTFNSCAPKKSVDDKSDAELRAYAKELADRFIILDGHIDLPDLLKEKRYRAGIDSPDTIINTGKGEFDYTRAKQGGLDAPFMSIYIPIEYQAKPDNGKALADSLINTVVAITNALPDKFALANTPADIEANTAAGKISLPMGMENGAPIGNDLANLKYFFDRGIRYITLAHNKDNQICDASMDGTGTWKGLSPYGKQVVTEMNRLGIIVDISHVDDNTFFQVMEHSKAPAIASHSSCRKFSPKARRDMNDEMIRKLGEKGGVMLINFYTAFLDSATMNNQNELSSMLKAQNLKETDSLAKPIIAEFKNSHPNPTTIEKVADHIDNVVQIAGIDHVGIGSDFDGVSGNLPVGLEDVSKYPDLIYTLLKRGYTEEDIEKICYKNAFRVWNKVIEISKQMQAQ
ncbi:MAG TPA: dipeptidase [Cyclobacteriaceae bacterium]|nr:dipeptidase [Cyclobacteriaceae bacterium]